METVPFEDPMAKIDNARDHIRLVETRFADFCREERVFRLSQDGGRTLISFGSGKPLPKNIAMATGDAIHNLRSALDVMAGDVVQASGESRRGVYFPFAHNEEELDKQIKEKKFNRARPEAIELLKTFEPFKGGNLALRALHDLDVSNKHQFVIRADRHHNVTMKVGGLTMINCTVGGNREGDVNVPSGIPFSTPEVSPALVFGPDQPLAYEDVIPTLHRFADLTLAIVESFAELFRSRSDPPTASPLA